MSFHGFSHSVTLPIRVSFSILINSQSETSIDLKTRLCKLIKLLETIVSNQFSSHFSLKYFLIRVVVKTDSLAKKYSYLTWLKKTSPRPKLLIWFRLIVKLVSFALVSLKIGSSLASVLGSNPSNSILNVDSIGARALGSIPVKSMISKEESESW